MRTIKITGKGAVKVHPDMTRITITLESIFSEYSEALEHSARDTDKLKSILEPLGFKNTELKTLSFSIDTEYEGYHENDEYKRRFVGYKYSHVMKLEFESDNERLGKVLYTLAKCDLHPEFRLSYTVKDAEAVKNEVLGKAVADSKAKAEILTKAAEVVLGDIQSIDYSWGEVEFSVSPMENSFCAAPEMKSFDMNIEPDDIEVSDTVTVVWEIA